MSIAAELTFLSVAEIGDRMAVKTDTVLAWINSGQLRAINVASPGCHRPRWRIDSADLDHFLAERRTAPRPPATRRRRRKNDHIIQFF